MFKSVVCVVPQVLKTCAEFIEKHGIVDGIYRLSGITSNIQRLRLAHTGHFPACGGVIYISSSYLVNSCLLSDRSFAPSSVLTSLKKCIFRTSTASALYVSCTSESCPTLCSRMNSTRNLLWVSTRKPLSEAAELSEMHKCCRVYPTQHLF